MPVGTPRGVFIIPVAAGPLKELATCPSGSLGQTSCPGPIVTAASGFLDKSVSSPKGGAFPSVLTICRTVTSKGPKNWPYSRPPCSIPRHEEWWGFEPPSRAPEDHVRPAASTTDRAYAASAVSASPCTSIPSVAARACLFKTEAEEGLGLAPCTKGREPNAHPRRFATSPDSCTEPKVGLFFIVIKSLTFNGLGA